MSHRILITRSNPIAPDPRVEKIARTLVQAGYTVTALGWDRTAKALPEDRSQGFVIRRLPIQADYGKGLGNLSQLLRWQLGLTRWLFRHQHEFDLIHACDFDTILPALLCKTLWHKQVIYDIFDFYADHLRNTPAALKKIIRKTDLSAIGAADAVILVDDARKQQIAGSRPKLCEIIYNSPEDVPGDITCTVSSSAPGSLCLAYIGLLQVERGLIEMLHVLARHPQWQLDLAGFGGDENRIHEMAASLPNITWHGRVPYAQAIQMSAAADVLFATYDPSIANHRYSSPNKLFEGMMLGKPMIVARDTNMDAVIEKTDCGLVIPYGDEIALEKALQLLADDPVLRQQLGSHARQAYDTEYSWKRMQERLLALYHQVEALQGKSR